MRRVRICNGHCNYFTVTVVISVGQGYCVNFCFGFSPLHFFFLNSFTTCVEVFPLSTVGLIPINLCFNFWPR